MKLLYCHICGLRMTFGRYRCDNCRHRARPLNWLTLPVLFLLVLVYLFAG